MELTLENAMLPKAKDRFEEWIRTPLPSDSSLEFRVAREPEFERVFDLIDEAFGVPCPRALFDWSCRRNPLGPARCWVGVEKLTGRFDSGFDEVTERCMAWKGFWCPHDAEFLNWRYLDRPSGTYRALAVLDGDEVAGYCVVRSDGRTALLMEFDAPELGEVPLLLLRSAMEAARAAGCRRLSFDAPPGWRHWPAFRAAGLEDRRPRRFLQVDTYHSLGAGRLEDWQLLPGDDDAS